jgi:recombination protein RecR
MFWQLPAFQQLIRQLQRVPYLASKNVYKVAIHFLTSDSAAVEHLCATILEAKKKLHPCVRCCNWAEDGDLCTICNNQRRNHSIICVIETWYDLFAIENAGEYNGVYHVLGGALCPLEGIGPNQLTIPTFLKRLDSTVKEVIFATNPTPEGEATASYIWSKIDKKSVHISKLASGVPTGSTLEYMDRVTIGKALLGRQPF